MVSIENKSLRVGAAPRARRGLEVWLLGGVLALLLLLLVRMLLLPDPGSTLFFKAQRLEAVGQPELALRHYDVLTKTHPESTFAPRAFWQQGDILTGLARRASNDAARAAHFRQAVAAYRQLAEIYPANALAGDALLAAGALAAGDLHDLTQAGDIYRLVLRRYPNNQEYSAQATLRLGRLALDQGDGKTAQQLLQRVVQHFARINDAGAEAQFYLGVTYETLFHNKDWAKNAYEATWKRYPQTVWASNAQGRLGMLFYADRPLVRRVQIEVAPLPDEGMADGSLFAALRPLLAARGLEAGQVALQGWSLAPFYAGFAPDDPARVVLPTFDTFQNVAANAGLIYNVTRGGDEKTSLKALQDELDAARPPVVYDGRWSLAIGYDLARDEVMLQNQGARVEAVAVAQFSADWKKPAPAGGSFMMYSFRAPGDKPIAKATPAPSKELRLPDHAMNKVDGGLARQEAAPSPTATPIAGSLATPTWIWTLKPLSTADAHRRTLRRAAIWMRRPRAGQTLLNLQALDALAGELGQLTAPPLLQAAPRVESPVPQPESEMENPGLPPDPEATATPAATPFTPQVAPRPDQLERARVLLGWFKEPLAFWLNTRRDAAAYLDNAADALRQPVLHQAAQSMLRSVRALQNAAAALPPANSLSDDGITLDANARRGFETAAREVRAAHAAEARAVLLMRQAS